jgi:hypothetical protein
MPITDRYRDIYYDMIELRKRDSNKNSGRLVYCPVIGCLKQVNEECEFCSDVTEKEQS